MNSAYDAIAKPLIDSPRAEYPETTLFAVPYRLGAGELYTRWANGEIPSLVDLVGTYGKGIYRDAFGHAGQILVDVSKLICLRSIYSVEPSNFDHGMDWSVDLTLITNAAIDEHDRFDNRP